MSIDLAGKIARLGAQHMLAPQRYRAELATLHGSVPHFDPDDGGDAARVLLMLETPSPRGGPDRFVSRDN